MRCTVGRFLSLALLPFPALAAPAFILDVSDSNAYRVTHADLAALAPDLGEIASDRLHLSLRDEPVPLHVHDGGDGRFGPGDWLSFHGERLHGRQSWFDTYAVTTAYRLEVRGSGHATAASTPAAPADGAPALLRRHLHLEEEALQIRLSNRWVQPNEEPDLWFWAKLTQIDPEPFKAGFALPGLATAGVVQGRLGFRGLSEVRAAAGQAGPKPADHVVEIMVNGKPVATSAFEGRDEHGVEFTLPAAALLAEGNVLQLRVPPRQPAGAADPLVDVVMFNHLALDYPITGDLDDTPLPIRVARAGTVVLSTAGDPEVLHLYGADGSRHAGQAVDGRWRFPPLPAGDYQPVPGQRYASPARIRPAPASRWRDVDQGYDYLLIAHPSLLEASAPLAEHHRAQGLRVAEIDVEHLYDEFNHGVTHPRAIRDFVAHAYHHWPAPRPRFVLLVGDASFDIRSDRVEDSRYAKWANRELLIPGQFGEIPGEHYRDTDKIGARRNLIPTWQYPSEEGHSAADNYFVAVDGDDWLPDLAIGRFPVVEPEEVTAIVAKTLGYANNTDFGDWRRQTLFATDTATHHKVGSDRLAATLEQQGFGAAKVYPSEDESDNEAHIGSLRQAFDDGQLLVHFIGHGGRYIWRTGPPDLTRNHDLFTLDHVAGMNNGDRLPMVLSMTCYSAPFDHPSADSIGERFLREPDRGAIAVFAASWRNTPSEQFSEAAISELMTPGAYIGEALMRAKQSLTSPWQRTLVETYNLLGDPAVVLKQPSLPLRLQAATDGSTVQVEVDSDEAVNGRARLQWQDAEGAVLASAVREMRGHRSVFQVPAAAAGASELHLHLTDYRSRTDGIARLELNRNGTADGPDAATAVADAPAPPSGVRRQRAPVDEDDQIAVFGLETSG